MFCPAGELPVLETVVQNVTGVFCPADLPVLVTVAVSDWCFLVLQEISLFW